MIKLKDLINQYKISFVNELIHSKSKGICLRVMQEERKLYPGTGLLDEVSDLCTQYYNIDDVTLMDDVDKDEIRRGVMLKGREEIWSASLKNRTVPYNSTHLKTPKMVHSESVAIPK